MFFLKNPRGGNVYILFSDKGLMDRDLEECRSLWRFLGASSSKERNRLKHISDVKLINTRSPGTIIVDESDDVIFKDLLTFYKYTKHSNKKVICLTASPDDGKDGIERKILQNMKYSTVQTNANFHFEMPRIDQEIAMKDAGEVMDVVE